MGCWERLSRKGDIGAGTQRMNWNYLREALGFPGGASGKPACQCRRHKRHGFDLWVGKIPWRRAWQPIPVFLPGESYGQRSLVTVHGAAKTQTRVSD